MTGLWFYLNRLGIAKLHGRERRLEAPPQLLGLSVAEIEYVPAVGVNRLREKTGGWRDMEVDEIRAADAYLRMVLPPPAVERSNDGNTA